VEKDEVTTGAASSDGLHPAVYIIMVCLAVVFVTSMWTFAAGQGYTGLAIAVASTFVFITVMLTFTLSRIRRRSVNASEADRGFGSFFDWISGEFETRHGRLRATDAMVELLLPLAAGAFGMAAFAIVFHFTIGVGPQG